MREMVTGTVTVVSSEGSIIDPDYRTDGSREPSVPRWRPVDHQLADYRRTSFGAAVIITAAITGFIGPWVGITDRHAGRVCGLETTHPRAWRRRSSTPIAGLAPLERRQGRVLEQIDHQSAITRVPPLEQIDHQSAIT